MFGIVKGTKYGLTARGPSAARLRTASSVSGAPGTAALTSTPIRSG